MSVVGNIENQAVRLESKVNSLLIGRLIYLLSYRLHIQGFILANVHLAVGVLS